MEVRTTIELDKLTFSNTKKKRHNFVATSSSIREKDSNSKNLTTPKNKLPNLNRDKPIFPYVYTTS